MRRSVAQVVAFIRDEIDDKSIRSVYPHARFPSTSKHIIECRGDGDINRFVWCLYLSDMKDVSGLLREIEREVRGLDELEIYTNASLSIPIVPFEVIIKPLPIWKKVLTWNEASLVDLVESRSITSLVSWTDFFKRVDLYVVSNKLEACKARIYPPLKDVFRIFELLPPKKIRVIIIGQDPYHGLGQAMGMSFSIKKGVPIPPSLRNIFKEIKACTGKTCTSGDLTPWVSQGVFLLNTALTVEEGKPGSHTKIWCDGQESFTHMLMTYLGEVCNDKTIVLLWGNSAKAYSSYFTDSKFKILRAAHPSPLSAEKGFFGCCHFAEVNLMLKSQPINWST